MFVYCLNNPVNYSDETGEFAVAILWSLPMIDGPLPIADIITAVTLVGGSLIQKKQKEKIVSKTSSEKIDWESGDKNHIIKGTRGKHLKGWKQMGIDPNNNNAWGSILPIMKEVVENADYTNTRILPDGSATVQFFKTYVEQGVQVMVKIWVDSSGTIQKLSDAIPRVFN